MWHSRACVAGVLMLAVLGVAQPQTRVDRSFKAISQDCAGVQWSEAALKTYPTIAQACQAVEERNGKTYVKFVGTVERNIDRGKQIEVKFKDGGTIKLTPPENLALYVNDRKTSVRELQRGTSMTFYVPEDQFAAHVPQDAAATADLVEVPIVQQAAATEPEPERTASLPATASNQGLLLLTGIALLVLAVLLTFMRGRKQGR